MRLLLDTHVAIWAALDPAALSDVERRLMRDARPPLALSAVSIWELRLKWQSLHISGARKGPIGPETIVAFAVAIGWTLVSLTARQAATSLVQTIAHKDPFDELLLVQAQEEGMRLLTRDTKLTGHQLVAA